jgi:hypothetical protein
MNFSLWKERTTKKIVQSTQTILLNRRTLTYTLAISPRAKRIRITIYPGGAVRITAPIKASSHQITTCISEKAAWILSKSDYYATLSPVTQHRETKQGYLQHKDEALQLVTQAIEKYNTFYSFTYKDIHIKNQKTLWGSCSRNGNLNFNYKIALLDERLRDYVVVHELCHLREFNHSSRFWDLVSKTIPNHKELRRELKVTGLRSQ